MLDAGEVLLFLRTYILSPFLLFFNFFLDLMFIELICVCIISGCIRMTSSPFARMFMLRALEKIYAEKEIRRSHHSQLKRAVEQALGGWWLSLSLPLTVCSYTHVTLLLLLWCLFRAEEEYWLVDTVVIVFILLLNHQMKSVPNSRRTRRVPMEACQQHYPSLRGMPSTAMWRDTSCRLSLPVAQSHPGLWSPLLTASRSDM